MKSSADYAILRKVVIDLNLTPEVALMLIAQIYKMVLRDILVKAVADTETKWDDKGVELLDRLFE